VFGTKDGFIDRDFTRFGQFRRAIKYGDLVFLKQMADAAVQLFGDFARTLDDFFQIESRRAGAQAIGVGVFDILVNFGRAQQRLGRYSAKVEANSP